jgi:hypothetical protein
MREYNYFLYGEDNGYGQAKVSKEPQGTVKMSITNTTTSTQDNILYKDASYIGLTLDKAVTDTYVIEYGKERLKVLYIVPQGRYRQVFMKYIG